MYQEPPVNEDADVSRIDAELEFEITYWSRRFRVTKAALRAAIARVGDDRREVARFLARPGQKLAA